MEAIAIYQLTVTFMGALAVMGTMSITDREIPDRLASWLVIIRLAKYPEAAEAYPAAIPTMGLRPTTANSAAPSAGINTIPASDARFDMTPTKITEAVSRYGGILSRNFFDSASNNPVLSATATPSMVTNTVLKGGNAIKLASMLLTNHWNPALFRIPLTTASSFPPGMGTVKPLRS